MSLRLLFAITFACLVAAAAFGQGLATSTVTAGGSVTASGSISGSFTTPGPHFVTPAVTGAAYSGEEVNERVQTLADGTHITQTMPGRRMYRDSQGRTRTERSMGPMSIPGRQVAADAPRMIEITDPVAGYQYTLDEQKKVAHRWALPQQNQPSGAVMQTNGAVMQRNSPWFTSDAVPPPPPPPTGSMISGVITAARVMPAPAQDGRPQPEFKNESLGTQTIDGVLCEGRRTTTTYPVDFQGNDRPITVTSEVWTSPELKMTILSKNNDPRSGENTFHIENLSRTEPDASLFQPPADYSIMDDTGPVTVYFGK